MNNNKNTQAITIVGSGLAGGLLAILLAKRGYSVHVYDKRPDPRMAEAEAGRSINLALSRRGWKALERAEIANLIQKKAIPMKGRMMHDDIGELTFQPYGTENQMIYSISRSGLNLTLIEQADTYENVSFHFNHACEEVDLENKRIHFVHNGAAITVKSDFIIGADGAFSRVRNAMQKTGRFNFSQEYIPHGYKELTIPPSAKGDFRIEPHALHIWPRKSFMLIALPNQDKSFTATLFSPFEGRNSFEELQSPEIVEHFFKTIFPDTQKLIPDLTSEFFTNPTSSLITIRCNPWIYQNSAVLVGDAAHAIVPFYGQGMNAAFEDCRVFDDLLEEFGGNWDKILPAYQKARVENGHAIADLALRNFVEMRDLVADPKFLLRKKIEAKLHALMPEAWVPLYTMVTFSDISYADALKRGKQQDLVMEKVMKEYDILNRWETIDWESHPALKDYVAEVELV